MHMTSSNDASESTSARPGDASIGGPSIGGPSVEDASTGDAWPELRVLSSSIDDADAAVQVQTETYADEQVGTWRTWLSTEEHRCLQSFGSEKRRREFMVGRAAARQLIGHCLDLAPSEVSLAVADDGAVDVRGGDLHLSIAHSGPHAVAVAAPHPVGVDLEAVVERDRSLIRFLLHPDERERVMQLFPYDTVPTIVLLWTLKESVLKARRSGFRLSPKKLRLDLDDVDGSLSSPPASGRVTIRVEGGTSWRVGYTSVLGDAAAPSSDPEPSAVYWSALAVPA